MLRARVIPCLLLRDKGLVKTRKFTDDKYVGDPINAVRIFNEKEVDELVLLDIEASVKGREPDFAMIADVAAECRMPLCYGGGIKTAEQARRILSLGVEKIALSSVLFENPDIVAEIAKEVGGQSVVAVLDVKKKWLSGYRVFIHNGKVDTGQDPVAMAKHLQELGIGEIVVNAIDRDGMMEGYDLDIAKSIRVAVNVPVTVMGGAGSLAHMAEAVRALGIVGLVAGSFFVFKGQFRAVLISYPDRAQRDLIQS
jgi:cyclase